MESPSTRLARLQSQVAVLEHERAKLTSQLLSLYSTHPLSSIAPPPVTLDETPQPAAASDASALAPSGPGPSASSSSIPTLDALTESDILARVFTSSADSQRSSITRLYRMTGITTFAVRDPSPPHPTLLGIRFDIFSKRTFRTPHYIVLGPAEESFAIHRHSIPPFFNVDGLHLRYRHDLSKFARTVRQKLQLYTRRLDTAKELEQLAFAAESIGDVTEPWTNRVESITWDLAVAVLVIKWRNGAKGWLVVDERGIVDRAVVKDVKGRRKRDVERVLANGALSGVAERIGWT